MKVLQEYPDNHFDLIVTDPPYGISFMGKDWDKALPDKQVWKECYRTLKDGKFAFIMCSPRQDVLSRMIISLEDAGFRTNYTSLYHTYASGFPKAKNNKDGSYVGFQPKPAVEIILVVSKGKSLTWLDDCRIPYSSDSDRPKFSNGAYGDLQRQSKEQGFRPYNDGIPAENSKHEPTESNPNGRFPANLLVEDDVLNNGFQKGTKPHPIHSKIEKYDGWGTITKKQGEIVNYGDSGSYSRYFSLDAWESTYAKTFPFLITPKASKSERNKGCEDLELHKGGPGFRQYIGDNKLVRKTEPNKEEIAQYLKQHRIKKGLSQSEVDALMGWNTKYSWLEGRKLGIQLTSSESWLKLKSILELDDRYDQIMTELIEVKREAIPPTAPRQNSHPTVKPLKLMSYLVTLGSREGDTILDPFMGSGTVPIAAQQLHRNYIGIEINEEYYKIAQARLSPYLEQTKLS